MNGDMDSYITIKNESHVKFYEKKSLFIGHACPVSDEESASAFLTGIKNEYPDATHNVYAYAIRYNNIMRYSDAGEPQGTAGMPVLDAIRKKGVSDAVVVVTRYFGGILLGGGGLVRAYSKSASNALEEAGIITMSPHEQYMFSCGYSEYEKVKKELAILGACEKSSEFSEDVKVMFTIDSSRAIDAVNRLKELTAGKSIPQKCGEVYCEL